MCNFKKKTLYFLFLLGLTSLQSCKKADDVVTPSENPFEEKAITNLQSNYGSQVFLKLSTGETTRNPDGDNWDIGFEHAQLKVNGGSMSDPSRTGNARGVIVDAAYSEIKEIPNLNSLKQDVGQDFALGYRQGGSSWYAMGDNQLYTPYTQKTILIQTADNKGFAKIQILSFYKDMPDLKTENYTTLRSLEGYYTLRYEYIEAGQRFRSL